MNNFRQIYPNNYIGIPNISAGRGQSGNQGYTGFGQEFPLGGQLARFNAQPQMYKNGYIPPVGNPFTGDGNFNMSPQNFQAPNPYQGYTPDPGEGGYAPIPASVEEAAQAIIAQSVAPPSAPAAAISAGNPVVPSVDPNNSYGFTGSETPRNNLWQYGHQNINNEGNIGSIGGSIPSNTSGLDTDLLNRRIQEGVGTSNALAERGMPPEFQSEWLRKYGRGSGAGAEMDRQIANSRSGGGLRDQANPLTTRDKWGIGLGIGGSLLNFINGMRQIGIQKDVLKFEKQAFNENLNTQKKLANDRLRRKFETQKAGNRGITQSTDDFVAQNLV